MVLTCKAQNSANLCFSFLTSVDKNRRKENFPIFAFEDLLRKKRTTGRRQCDHIGQFESIFVYGTFFRNNIVQHSPT
jgi:hypothetical protein